MAKSTEIKDTEAKREYTVHGNLLHSHKTYRKGGTISLTEKEAAPLLAIGTIKEK